jgi:hypothetical protein
MRRIILERRLAFAHGKTRFQDKQIVECDIHPLPRNSNPCFNELLHRWGNSGSRL